MIFHKFTIGDCEDPEIYAAGQLLAWESTDAGEWVMKHCPDTRYKIMSDFDHYGYQVVIYGNLSEQDTTYYTLKYK